MNENNELFDFADSDVEVEDDVLPNTMGDIVLDKKDEKRKLKEKKKAEKELIKVEKRKIRQVKNTERKERIILISKVLLTAIVVLSTSSLNSFTFMLLGFTRLSMLFVLPSIFMIPGLLIPLIWVKKGSRGLFFTIWLICSLTYLIGLAVPTLMLEYDTLSLAVRTAFEWIGGLFA